MLKFGTNWEIKILADERKIPVLMKWYTEMVVQCVAAREFAPNWTPPSSCWQLCKFSHMPSW